MPTNLFRYLRRYPSALPVAAIRVAAASASFVYDGDGNRVKATVGGVTTLYPGRHYEYVNSTTYTKYYHAGSDLVAFERSSGYGSTAGYGRRFVFRDHLNSTSVIVNGSNSTIAKDLYRPYGDVRYQWRSGATALQTTYRYTSQRMEVGLGAPSPVGGLDRGLYFYGARWYDASLARFIQADTIVPEPENPQSLNRYTYTRGNPLKYRDPSGHAECIDESCDIVFEPHKRRLIPRGRGAASWYFQSGLEMVRDWLAESGPQTRYYGASAPMTRDLMRDEGVQLARENYYSTGRAIASNYV